jgi:flagellar FliJ protein
MKKFQFRLQAVLEERKKTEEVRLRDFTLAQRVLQKFIDELNRLETRLLDSYKECDQAKASNSIEVLQTFENFIDGTKKRIEWKRQEIERGKKITEKKRLEYVAARQKREVLEKLKERKVEEHKLMEKKRELKNLDDLYVMRAILRTREIEEEDQKSEEEIA